MFSEAPGPSPTFQCAPGGTAIAVREPFCIRKLFPPTPHRWYLESRLCSGLLISGDFAMVLISLYAYPMSNPLRSANEEMFRSVFAWASSLNMPVLVGGDFNSSLDSSPSLSLSYQLDLFPLSPPHLATTKTRTGRTSARPAIDLLFGNLLARDCVNDVTPNYDISLSDHYPVEGTLTCDSNPYTTWH